MNSVGPPHLPKLGIWTDGEEAFYLKSSPVPIGQLAGAGAHLLLSALEALSVHAGQVVAISLSGQLPRRSLMARKQGWLQQVLPE